MTYGQMLVYETGQPSTRGLFIFSVTKLANRMKKKAFRGKLLKGFSGDLIDRSGSSRSAQCALSATERQSTPNQ
jgi:hypothetical protein